MPTTGAAKDKPANEPSVGAEPKANTLPPLTNAARCGVAAPARGAVASGTRTDVRRTKATVVTQQNLCRHSYIRIEPRRPSAGTWGSVAVEPKYGFERLCELAAEKDRGFSLGGAVGVAWPRHVPPGRQVEFPVDVGCLLLPHSAATGSLLGSWPYQRAGAVCSPPFTATRDICHGQSAPTRIRMSSGPTSASDHPRNVGVSAFWPVRAE